jgi:hypothetical protein
MTLSTRKVVATLLACVALAVGASGCGAVDAVTGGAAPKGVAVYISVDDSGSTAPERGIGGLYEAAVMQAIVGTAREGDGRVYATPIDGNSVADATWIISGKRFVSQIGGNQQLGAAARAHAAENLRPTVRQLLHAAHRPATDILGGLQRVALSAAGSGRKRLVLITDGGVNIGTFDIYRTPPETARQRKQVIARLRRAGELPDLHNFDVYLVGVGLGYHSRATARAAIALWHDLIVAAGGRLMSNDVTLHFPG